MSTRKFEWTPDNVAKAQEMWRDDKPAADIASALGTSRSSVLGKAARLRDRFPLRDPLKSKTMDAVARRDGVERRRASSPRMRAKPAPVNKVRQRALERARTEVPNWADSVQILPKSDLSRFRLESVEPVAFVDLGRRQCRFPLECFEVKSGPRTPCCGAETEIGIDYCGAHLVVMAGRID
nr:GcrA cell cycle regulator [Rhizobium sp. Q54]